MATVASPNNHWKMNDNAASTTVVDAIGNNDGTAAQNTDQLDTTGKINNALTFNGNGDFITCGDINGVEGITEFSVSVWIYISATATAVFQSVLSKDEREPGNGATWSLWIEKSDSTFYIACRAWVAAADQHMVGSVAVTTAAWHHVVFTYNNGTMSYYLDGLFRESDSTLSGDLTTSNAPVRIGRAYYDTEADNDFKGNIDDVRIYTFALTAVEVLGIYNGGHGTEDENPSVELGINVHDCTDLKEKVGG